MLLLRLFITLSTCVLLCVAFTDPDSTFCETAEERSPRHYSMTCQSYGCRSSYMKCDEKNGEGVVMPCPPGLLWNDETRRCAWGIYVFARSEACNDLGIDRSIRPCGTATIRVNGIQRSLMKRGVNIALVNHSTGEYIESASFDTHGVKEDNYIEYIKGIRNGTIVIIAIQDEASKRQTELSRVTLKLIGAKSGKARYRQSMALLGFKGKETYPWVREEHRKVAEGPAEFEQFIPIGQL